MAEAACEYSDKAIFTSDNPRNEEPAQIIKEMEEGLSALEKGRVNKGKPFCIIADTIKGKGVSFMENVRGWHGKPPSDDQLVTALNEIKEGF